MILIWVRRTWTPTCHPAPKHDDTLKPLLHYPSVSTDFSWLFCLLFSGLKFENKNFDTLSLTSEVLNLLLSTSNNVWTTVLNHFTTISWFLLTSRGAFVFLFEGCALKKNIFNAQDKDIGMSFHMNWCDKDLNHLLTTNTKERLMVWNHHTTKGLTFQSLLRVLLSFFNHFSCILKMRKFCLQCFSFSLNAGDLNLWHVGPQTAVLSTEPSVCPVNDRSAAALHIQWCQKAASSWTQKQSWHSPKLEPANSGQRSYPLSNSSWRLNH